MHRPSSPVRLAAHPAAPVPLSYRSTPSSTCSTLCRPCSSRPSTPSPPRTSTTSKSCTSSWPGESPLARPLGPAPPCPQPLQPGEQVVQAPRTSLSPFPGGIQGSYGTVLLPSPCHFILPGLSSPGAPVCCSAGVWL